jgi:3-hydroxyacyl-CoA dehydrogenase
MPTASIVTVAVADDIATVTIDNPPVNTITAELRAGLRQALDLLEKLPALKGVLLQCAGSTFCSGADIGEFSGPPKELEYRDLFGRMEALPVPVVVALHGTVLGGGLELALSGHYRVAAPKTRVGFPEVTLGIFPGATGTQRMPRLIGAERTLEMIISARPIDAPTALQYGIVDRIVDGELPAAALAYLQDLITAGKGPRRTGELAVNPSTANAAVFAAAAAQAKKLYPNREAALAAIEAVRASTTLPFAQGLERETALVNVCKERVESRGAVHVFFAERECRKVPGLPADAVARPVVKAGIIGAGTMGGGIAICFVNAGIPVTVVDINEAALQRGLGVVSDTLESQVKRGRITADAKAKLMGLIKGSLSYDDLRDADVIIEAAVERMDLKKEVFRRMDAVAKPGCLLATNTSTLDIDDLATAVERPTDVVGMHFFSPANVMPLLEVIRTKASSGSAIRTAMELARPLRKTPVLSGVCYGFIGNRMMEGYAREAERMVLEGATPRAIDTVLEQWGMAMGILAVFDMAGVDVGVHIHRGNPGQYPPDPTYYQADFALFDAGRMGQKNGKGYYKYLPGDRNRHDDPEALAILTATSRRLNVPQRQHSPQEIEQRCLYPLLNEGFRILEEGIALRAGDIDVVWTSGYGFPRYRGGPMFYAETIGLKTLYEGMLKYQREFGPMHWQPAALLQQLVESGQTLAQWEAARKPQ